MTIRVEYDDGKPVPDMNGSPKAIPRGRARGFYIVTPDGVSRRLPVGYMRIGEIAGVEKVLNEVLRSC